MIVSVLISLAVGFGLGWLVFGTGPDTADKDGERESGTDASDKELLISKEGETLLGGMTDKTKTTPPVESSAGKEGRYRLSVNEQTASSRVVVSGMTLAERSWIVIHEEREAEPGSILGAGRFGPGTEQGEVELLRNTEPGKKYFAMIHADDGDDTFDQKKDLPLKDESGQVVMVSFATAP